MGDAVPEEWKVRKIRGTGRLNSKKSKEQK
jgi:hypothetical protein